MYTVAIDLQKHFAKIEVGKSFTCIDVYLFNVAGDFYFFMGSEDPENISRIRILNNNRTIIKQ